MIPISTPVYARLVDCWKDPDIATGDIVERFDLSPADVRHLKDTLGKRGRPAAMSAWWWRDRKKEVTP